jgi:DNA-binding NarL/FixJ family response regulator
MGDMVRLVIVHRRRLFREGLALALSEYRNLLVIAHAAQARDLIATLHELQPHVIIVDFALPEREGLDEMRKFRQMLPSAKILVIGMTELESDILACIEAGAAGYLPQDSSLHDLVDNIRAVSAGEALCSPKIVSFLFSYIAAGPGNGHQSQPSALAPLTRREREIIPLIEEGLSNKEIAVKLHIEVQTVKNHVHNILEKLRLVNRRQVAQYARDYGLLRPVT